MYDSFKLLNYSNSLVSPELYARHLSRLFTGNVVDGLTLVPKTGLTVTLQAGNGFIPYGSGATASAREFSLVADFDITLDTADASNPRIDLIVVYVDMTVSLPGGVPTSANLDGPGVVKATFVKGTPNSSPVDPTVGAIQTKIGGAGNPYIIVGAVRVDALAGTIAVNKITDRRTFAKLAPKNMDKSLDWWEEIGRTTLSSAGDVITVSNLPAKKYLRVIFMVNDTGGTVGGTLRFNNDSSNNYAERYSGNNAADTTSVNASGLLFRALTGSFTQLSIADIYNFPSEEKLGIWSGGASSAGGAGTAPSRVDGTFKWVNTASQINRLDVINNGTGDFAIGSEIIVLGHD